jgi:Leucine-rich repeat (LRR) protein
MQMTDAGLEELASLLPDVHLYHRQLDPERLAAKWVLGRKGMVVVELGDQKLLTVETVAALPRNACRVLQVTLKSGSCKPEEIAPALQACRNLQVLDLAGFGELRSKHLAAVAAFPSLTGLNLSNTGVNDDVFAHLGSLKNLRSLDLDSTDVTGEKLAQHPLPALRQFSAGTSSLNDAGLKNLAACSNLEILRVGNCMGITDKGFAALESLTNLQDLDLWRTRITDASVAVVAKLNKLRRLRLTGTAIGDPFIMQLKEMPDLATIELANTKVTDASLAHLKDFPSLKLITSYGTGVTDAGAKPLIEKGIDVIKSADAAERDPNAAPGRFGP